MSNGGGESICEGHEPWLFLPGPPFEDSDAGAEGKTFEGFYGGLVSGWGKEILRGGGG